MNFKNNELTDQVAQTARDFANQYIRPHLMDWDESQEFPVHIFKEMGKLGLMGVLVPEEYGGSGMGYYEYNAVIQEVSKVCGSIGLSLAAHNSPRGAGSCERGRECGRPRRRVSETVALP
jgi:alkylation response protein AidB-like acyl-CoA dehydrogenase